VGALPVTVAVKLTVEPAVAGFKLDVSVVVVGVSAKAGTADNVIASSTLTRRHVAPQAQACKAILKLAAPCGFSFILLSLRRRWHLPRH
jgi:hypothetical protein